MNLSTGQWLGSPVDILGFLGAGSAALASTLFVYWRNRSSFLHRSWLSLSLSTALWTFATVLMRESISADWAVFWARLSYMTFSFIPVFLLQFHLALLDAQSNRYGVLLWNKRLGVLFGVLGLITPLLIREVALEQPYGFHPVAGPFYGVFAFWFSGLSLASLWLLLKEYRLQIGYRRNQMRYVILASVIGLTSFLFAFPSTFGIPIYSSGYGLVLYYALMTYAMIRWRLMDISIVVKNTLIYTALYSILVGLFVVVVVFFGQVFLYGPQTLDRRVLWMCVIALSIVTAVVRPLDSWLRRLTDRVLFQSKYEWQKTLKEASRGMTRVTSVDHLLKLMAHFIGMRLRVTHVGILHRFSNLYTLKVSRGRYKRAVGVTVGGDNPLIAWLEEKKEILTVDEVRSWLRSERLFPRRTVIRRTLEEILEEMQALGAEVCVPAFSKGQMLELLVLGEKLSGDPYSQEDLDILSTLANEAAIALENAQLYQQLFQRMGQIEELYRREHQLFIHTAIALAAAVDARDPYTHGHTERTTAYALAIIDELGTHPEIVAIPHFKELLTIAALLHDIGKIGIPDEILRKPAKLTPSELKKMQEHPVIGAIILQPIKGMEEVARAVKAHHERFDGRGYPDGLRETEIPLMTRIISVADTFDSMTTDRPYRRRLSDTAAIREIEACVMTQFDPMVVEAFLKAYRTGRIVKRPLDAMELIG